MPDRARALTLADLAVLANLSASEHQPQELYAAVDALVQTVVGHKLFTIMRVHEASMEVERVHSSNLVAYPVGGRKTKRGTPWSKAVLDRGEVFVARTADEVREAKSSLDDCQQSDRHQTDHERLAEQAFQSRHRRLRRSVRRQKTPLDEPSVWALMGT